MSRLADVMEATWAYRLWQTPFARAKLRPFLRRTNLSQVRRVLDIGCGPGTNTALFAHTDYTGLDINEGYIEYARRRYHRDFRVADATRLDAAAIEPADLIVVNSLLHHLDAEETGRTLAAVRDLLTSDGAVHILELALPEKRSVARIMAQLDRGQYPRPATEWRSIFGRHFREQHFEQYRLAGGLWAMVYFRGGAAAGSPGT